MEDNKINVKDYVLLNKAYLDKQTEIENKIKEELISNPQQYPSGAEELYFFNYGKELTPDEEDKISLIDSLMIDRFSEEYSDLDALREKIVSLIGHVEIESEGENTGEN